MRTHFLKTYPLLAYWIVHKTLNLPIKDLSLFKLLEILTLLTRKYRLWVEVGSPLLVIKGGGGLGHPGS